MKKVILFLFATLLLASCGNDNDNPKSEDKYPVTVSEIVGGNWIKMTNHTNYIISFTEETMAIYMMNAKTNKIDYRYIYTYSIRNGRLYTKDKDGKDGMYNDVDIYFENKNKNSLYIGLLGGGFYYTSK